MFVCLILIAAVAVAVTAVVAVCKACTHHEKGFSNDTVKYHKMHTAKIICWYEYENVERKTKQNKAKTTKLFQFAPKTKKKKILTKTHSKLVNNTASKNAINE